MNEERTRKTFDVMTST